MTLTITGHQGQRLEAKQHDVSLIVSVLSRINKQVEL